MVSCLNPQFLGPESTVFKSESAVFGSKSAVFRLKIYGFNKS